MHSLALPHEAAMHEHNFLKTAIQEAVSENILLSAQRQAEFILKKMTATPIFTHIRYPKLVLSIQRII